MHGEVKKSKSENRIRLGPIICKMMRGFQIWPQNSNPITFDPLFGQKTVESRDFWKNPQKISRFEFFGQKGGQILSDFNSAARFGILSSIYIS